jgi:hypothetical protein
MAKQSYIKAIRGKSTAMYKTGGTRPYELHAIHALMQGNGFFDPNADEKAERSIDGGFKNKSICPTCFVRFSKNGSCNCA